MERMVRRGRGGALRLRQLARSSRERVACRGKPRIHLLHIGKTGGTALRNALAGRACEGRFNVVMHLHATTMDDVPAHEQVVFMLRDPIDRFVSAFYSRRRQGQPAYYFPWSEAEAAAFEQFRTPRDLAEALGSKDNAEAVAAMRAIQHVRDPYTRWLGRPEDFSNELGRVFFVGYVESLDRDTEMLGSLLGLRRTLKLPSDPVQAHQAPLGEDRELSELAAISIAHWYRDDFALMKVCREFREAAGMPAS